MRAVCADCLLRLLCDAEILQRHAGRDLNCHISDFQAVKQTEDAVGVVEIVVD